MISGPFVFDTLVLGRRPGTEKSYELVLEAPENLGLPVFGVPEGSPVELELRLEVVMEGVLATGTASVHAVGECVRCLIDVEEDLDADFAELYLNEDADEDQLALEDDLLDLEPVLRDAVVLALPHHPLCDPECPGLCPDCGVRLADDPDHTHGDAIDPRWSTLTQLTERPEE